VTTRRVRHHHRCRDSVRSPPTSPPPSSGISSRRWPGADLSWIEVSAVRVGVHRRTTFSRWPSCKINSDASLISSLSRSRRFERRLDRARSPDCWTTATTPLYPWPERFLAREQAFQKSTAAKLFCRPHQDMRRGRRNRSQIAFLYDQEPASVIERGAEPDPPFHLVFLAQKNGKQLTQTKNEPVPKPHHHTPTPPSSLFPC